MVRALRAQGVATQVEGLDDAVPGGAHACRQGASAPWWPSVRARSAWLASSACLLVAGPAHQPGHNALAVQEANREYRARAGPRRPAPYVHRHPDLSLFLAVFGADAAGGGAGQAAGTPC